MDAHTLRLTSDQLRDVVQLHRSSDEVLRAIAAGLSALLRHEADKAAEMIQERP